MGLVGLDSLAEASEYIRIASLTTSMAAGTDGFSAAERGPTNCPQVFQLSHRLREQIPFVLTGELMEWGISSPV